MLFEEFSASVSVLVDGKECDGGRVSVFDRGFLFGDSVFEVLRAYGGRPFALRAHLERLWASMRKMGIIPGFGPALIEEEVKRVLVRFQGADAYLRIVVSRGPGALRLDPATAFGPPVRVVMAAPLPPFPADLYDGVHLASVRADRPNDSTPARGAKISAYIANLFALLEAKARGAYEAALVREDGAITEGHSSNLFVVKGGELHTPPVSSGILPGITRGIVIEEAKHAQIPVRERLLFASDFESAEEAFLTSSLREIVPVIRFDGVRIGNGQPGPITRLLHERYKARVRAELGIA
ncbi:MAG: aminotransferase class IV [Deltaproteobacteria bacterium]|nr:aminotransferase class IV [Deltaproteobacteria bacterium]